MNLHQATKLLKQSQVIYLGQDHFFECMHDYGFMGLQFFLEVDQNENITELSVIGGKTLTTDQDITKFLKTLNKLYKIIGK